MFKATHSIVANWPALPTYRLQPVTAPVVSMLNDRQCVYGEIDVSARTCKAVARTCCLGCFAFTKTAMFIFIGEDQCAQSFCS